jgi:hypothetical protein
MLLLFVVAGGGYIRGWKEIRLGGKQAHYGTRTDSAKPPPAQDCKYTVVLYSNEVRVEARGRSVLSGKCRVNNSEASSGWYNATVVPSKKVVLY